MRAARGWPHIAARYKRQMAKGRGMDMPGNRNFKLGAWVSGMVAGLAIVTVLLTGIPAQAQSQSERAAFLETLFLMRLQGDATKFGLSLGPFHESLLSQIPGGLFSNNVRSPVFPSPFVTPLQAIQLLNTPASSSFIADFQRQLPGLAALLRPHR
jgi:hypothetical protein